MTAVSLKPVSRENIIPLIGLKVAASQREFVAANEISLAQAPYETGCYPLEIWADDRLVGFCSLINNQEHEFLDDGDDPKAVFIWRLMIAGEHQKNGFGSAVLEEIVKWGRGKGCTSLVVTSVESNQVARDFYLSRGFTETGRSWDDEIEMQRFLE